MNGIEATHSETFGFNIEELYTRYGPMVLRRCRQLLNDNEKSLDAMQEVFVKLMKYKNRLKNQYPSSLLYRIATNICLNMIRAQRYRQATSDDDVLTGIACFDETENRHLVTQWLDHIFQHEKPSTREIAVMHYIDGLTLQQTADEVGLSLSGVRKRLRELQSRVSITKEAYYE